MKRFFTATILSMALLTTQVEAKTLQFAQISDMHLSPIAIDEIEENNLTGGDYLLKAIKEINSNKEIEFVIFSGDSIDEPNKKTMAKFLTIADKLNKPYYIIIGDKEVLRRKNFDKKNFMRAYKRHNLSKIFKKPNYIIKPNRELVFVFLDGTNEVIPSTSGFFKSETLKWLDKKLKKYQNKKVVIVQHYPVVPPASNVFKQTVEPEKYFHVLNNHDNVIAIISGHFHKDSTIYKKGIYHISAPAFMMPHYGYKIINIQYEPKYLFSDPAEFEISQKTILLREIENDNFISQEEADDETIKILEEN